MTTIKQLREMPVGTRIGGGFVLTVKMTKKSVQLPNKQYVHTVVLCDETGEMVADFLDPGTYLPVKKGQQIKIIVAEIQELVLKAGDNGVKLYVSQFQVITQTIDEYEADTLIYQSRMELEIRGKIRHGLVCAYIRAGVLTLDKIDKARIEELVEYIYNGTDKPKTDV